MSIFTKIFSLTSGTLRCQIFKGKTCSQNTAAHPSLTQTWIYISAGLLWDVLSFIRFMSSYHPTSTSLGMASWEHKTDFSFQAWGKSQSISLSYLLMFPHAQRRVSSFYGRCSEHCASLRKGTTQRIDGERQGAGQAGQMGTGWQNTPEFWYRQIKNPTAGR